MSSDELRDAIAGALYVRDRFDSPTVVLADAILALPEMLSMVERISELEAEIERLRAAGDEMADAATRQQWSRLDVAVAAWQEARRG